MQVIVGEHDLSSTRSAERHQIASGYIHHNHDGQSLENDIALLRLRRPLRLKPGVCLVCLPARNSPVRPGTRCVVTGYGYTSESGPAALKVRQAQVPVVSESRCSARINAATDRPFVLPTSSFCAGGESGSDACQVQSGFIEKFDERLTQLYFNPI
jgi:secreted trypsin-like serine protease